jgi:hypothetical protein
LSWAGQLNDTTTAIYFFNNHREFTKERNMSETLKMATGSLNKPDDVPRPTKQPKSRPPTGIREHILRTPLPYYSGPYSVGVMDIEVPARQPRYFSDIKREHRHLLELETVLFSVFYPSGFGSGQGKSPEGEKKWSRPTWLPRPRIEVAKGYGKFAGIPSWPTVGWFGEFSGRDVERGELRKNRDDNSVHQAPSFSEREIGGALAAS